MGRLIALGLSVLDPGISVWRFDMSLAKPKTLRIDDVEHDGRKWTDLGRVFV